MLFFFFVYAAQDHVAVAAEKKAYRVVPDGGHVTGRTSAGLGSNGGDRRQSTIPGAAGSSSSVSRRSYSKSVHFKPTKAYNGRVSKIYVLDGSSLSNDV
jgi:hypothetical protein